MDPIRLLSQAHQMCTLSQPICHNRIYVKNCKKIPETKEEKKDLLQRAFIKFQKRQLPIGSVHADPIFWYDIFIETFDKKKEYDDYIDVPNGCCNNKTCPIATFYNDISDVLSE